MTQVAVTTTLDRGGAESIAAALDERGIPATIHSTLRNFYFGSATLEALEVRVPIDRLDDARGALALIAEEVTLGDNLGWDVAEDRVVLPRSLRRGDTADRVDRADQDGTAPSVRHPRWFWTWPFTYLLKVPAGCLYARHERLGYLLLGTGIAGFVMFALTGSQSALLVWAAAILLDLCAAPVLTAIAKRRSAR